MNKSQGAQVDDGRLTLKYKLLLGLLMVFFVVVVGESAMAKK
jgi:hypothetical protein